MTRTSSAAPPTPRWIETTARLGVEREPSLLTALRRPLEARSGTTTSTLSRRTLRARAMMLSLLPLAPTNTIVARLAMARPRMRSTLPVLAAAVLAQPATHETPVIFGRSEA
jgi:hypothetical protein